MRREADEAPRKHQKGGKRENFVRYFGSIPILWCHGLHIQASGRCMRGTLKHRNLHAFYNRTVCQVMLPADADELKTKAAWN